MQKLHETCLITEDDISYLKSILHFLKRDDLIVKITELESPGFVFQKGRVSTNFSLLRIYLMIWIRDAS